MNVDKLLPGRAAVTFVSVFGIVMMATSAIALVLQVFGAVQLMFSAWVLAVIIVTGFALVVLAHARALRIEDDDRARMGERERRTAMLVSDRMSQTFILNNAVLVLMQRANIRSLTFNNEDFIKIAGMGVPLLFESPHDDSYTVVVREPFKEERVA